MALTLGVAASTAFGGCQPARLPAPPPARVIAATAPPPPPPRLSEWTFWEGIDVPVLPTIATATLPLDAEQLVRTPAADERWSEAPAELRNAVLARGFAVTDARQPRARIGEMYAALRDEHVPWVVTIDTLLFLTHLALSRATAEVDTRVTIPSLETILHRLDARLATASHHVRADVAAAYRVARGIVAVARALADKDYAPEPELASIVDAEKARVLAHTGSGVSPWLGAPLDYSSMAPRAMADHDEARAGWYRAAAWLQQAALALEGRGEGAVLAQVDVATARDHARAALLLSRLLDYEVDKEASVAWTRIEQASELLVGGPDDATVRDMAAAAARAKLDLRDADWIANVASVDRVRHAAARERVSTVYDGAGGARAPAAGLDPTQPIGLIAPDFRLLAPRAMPDAATMQALVFPRVGGVQRAEAPPTARDGVRALPSALDVAAWLGAHDARALLHDRGDDAYAHYDDALDGAMHARPPGGSPERHRTPYSSMIDALETWLAPSSGDRAQPGAGTSEWRRRKAEVALCAWTALRHDATILTRVPSTARGIPPARVVASSVPSFVEPHPEAIAKLVALVRQTSRALSSEGLLPPDSPGRAVLDDVDDLLWTALGIAMHEANDETPPPELSAALTTFPDRLLELETSLADTGEADVPIAIDVHTDLPRARALEEATGAPTEGWFVMREPKTHTLVLAIGASIPHYEIIEPASRRLTDSMWRNQLASEGAPARDPLARPYVVLLNPSGTP